MKRKPLITIEEQMYRAGIWERPFKVFFAKVADAMVGIDPSETGLRIISDGTPEGSRVIDGATGKTIRGVTRVEWSVDAFSLILDMSQSDDIRRSRARRRHLEGPGRGEPPDGSAEYYRFKDGAFRLESAYDKHGVLITHGKP